MNKFLIGVALSTLHVLLIALLAWAIQQGAELFGCSVAFWPTFIVIVAADHINRINDKNYHAG